MRAHTHTHSTERNQIQDLGVVGRLRYDRKGNFVFEHKSEKYFSLLRDNFFFTNTSRDISKTNLIIFSEENEPLTRAHSFCPPNFWSIREFMLRVES